MRVVHTRVAVVQLAYHPAIVADRRSPLEDPLWRPDKPDSLLPPGDTIPEVLASRFDALRRRIREAYGDQILNRAREILAAASRLGVRIIVFPDYSLPWEILGGVADAAGEIVVVAGGHTVDRAARRSGLYERLGVAEDAHPSAGQVVCPVLYRGRALALVPRLRVDPSERTYLRPSEVWAPVAMPDGIAGPMGVIAAQDLVDVANGPHHAALTDVLAACRFLAMPSFAMRGEGKQLNGRAWIVARSFGRPVLYAAASADGGTSIFVDEGRPAELRAFPDRVGALDSGDEGAIVAGVDLDHDRTEKQIHPTRAQAVIPIAAASLVYRAHPVADAYAAKLVEAENLLSRDDGEALDALAARVEQHRDLLLNAGALPGAKARQRRLSRLLAELDKVTTVEDIRRFLREIVLPPDVLPLGDLRAAMAGGAADCVFAWMRDVRSEGLVSVETQLRAEMQTIEMQSEWTAGSVETLARVALTIREPPAALEPSAPREEERAPSEPPPSAETEMRVVLPKGIDPVAVGLRRNGGFLISFRSRPEDFLRRDEELQPRSRTDSTNRISDLQNAHRRVAARDLDPFAFDFSEIHQWAAEDLHLLAVAEGAQQVMVAAVRPEGEPFGAMLVLSFQDTHWVAWEVGKNHWLSAQWEPLQNAFAESGLGAVNLEKLQFNDYHDRIAGLLRRFDGAKQKVHELRAQRLREVGGHFVEPDVRIGTDPAKVPLIQALDAWVRSGDQTALLLGEFGSGKSTGLTEWAVRCWAKPAGIFPIVVNLAGAPASRDAESLLLEAAATDDTPANRAALRLLIRRGPLLACFDGFDEMATRLDSADLSSRLSTLMALGKGGGKVVISSRDSYFPTDADLRSTTERALLKALGTSSGIRRLWVQPFTQDQVEALVSKVRPDSVVEALDRIAQTYDLKDLVTRPLLLGMVLSTLDDLSPGAKVGTADLYEAYLARWLEQTRSSDPECFTDKQKIEFAESLAEQLWRSGQPSCTWQELQQSVRARLSRHLPEGMPIGAAFLEMQGGAFFARDDDDRYRFAHKSFLEYFLARGFIQTLAERPREALATRPISPEVSAFVGEILKRQGNPKEENALKSVRTWLGGKMLENAADAESVAARANAAKAIFGSDEHSHWKALAESKANALRLLLGLARWSNEPRGWIPEGAHLRHMRLVGEDLSGALLVAAHLDGTDLSGVNLSDADLTRAVLDEARLVGARLFRTELSAVVARGADFTQVEAHQANLEEADLSGAVLRGSMWTACRWKGVKLNEADVTGWAAPGPEGPADGHSVSISAQRSFVTIVAEQGDKAHALLTNSRGTWLANAGADAVLRLWDIETGKVIARFEGHGSPIAALAWNPAGTRLATAEEDGTALLWNIQDGREITRLENHTSKNIWTLQYSPTGTILAGATREGILLWDGDTGALLSSLSTKSHDRLRYRFAFNPSGTVLASTGGHDPVSQLYEGAITLWDVKAGKAVGQLAQPGSVICAMEWHPSGPFLTLAAVDGTLQLWEADSQRLINSLQLSKSVVVALAWDPKGNRLASVDSQGSVTVLNSNLEKQGHKLDGAGPGVPAVVWNREGNRLASATYDGVVRIWDPDRNVPPVVFATAQESSLFRTPGGFCQFAEGDSDRYRLTIWRPRSKARLILPLGGLREIFHRPDKVAAALAGDLSGDTLGVELKTLGFDNGVPWDGKTRTVTKIDIPPPPLPVAPKALDASAPNPFRPGPALTGAESLPGREPVVAELIALIEGRSPAILRGPRRCGKTSILHLLPKRLASSRHILHVTLEATRIVTPDDLACVLDPNLKEKARSADTLRQLLREQRGAVLLLDEVANLEGADPSVFAWLRAVGQEEAAVVLAGSHWDWVRVVEHAAKAPGSSFGNDVTPVDLGPLPEADALRFLVESAPPDVPIEQERTAKWIVELCGPWPFYLQVMGHAVVQAVRAGNRLSLVDRRGVSDLYEQRLLLDRDAVFRGRFAELPERVKRILFASRESKPPLYRELSRDDRKILRDTGLCNPFGYWLEDRPFFDWIRRSADDPEGAH